MELHPLMAFLKNSIEKDHGFKRRVWESLGMRPRLEILPIRIWKHGCSNSHTNQIVE